MNEILGRHDLLLESSNWKEAELRARYFCEHNDLVRYDSIIIESDAILCGTDPEFNTKLNKGLEGNKKATSKLIEELRTEGALDPEIWPTLQQGYATKLLHTMVHLLDGFFGIDSVLYNLVENSHQVNSALLSRIQEHPEKYWLVPVAGISTHGNGDRVPFLRPFGREK
ncbi:MAG: hypothetical protein JRF04_00235 [Deltaproteobacteria bacterium]|nr:hypothetical protein [Deltaproteobacteria bacterium]